MTGRVSLDDSQSFVTRQEFGSVDILPLVLIGNLTFRWTCCVRFQFKPRVSEVNSNVFISSRGDTLTTVSYDMLL